MNKFSRQFLMLDCAKDISELDNYDYGGYDSWLKSYPIYITKFLYIIENLYYKNSLLRKKLHECKQRNHSMRKLIKSHSTSIFEKWLEETLQNDPTYKFQIVCNYYDDCEPCPLHEVCKLDIEYAFEYLDKPCTEK